MSEIKTQYQNQKKNQKNLSKIEQQPKKKNPEI